MCVDEDGPGTSAAQKTGEIRDTVRLDTGRRIDPRPGCGPYTKITQNSRKDAEDIRYSVKSEAEVHERESSVPSWSEAQSGCCLVFPASACFQLYTKLMSHFGALGNNAALCHAHGICDILYRNSASILQRMAVPASARQDTSMVQCKHVEVINAIV